MQTKWFVLGVAVTLMGEIAEANCRIIPNPKSLKLDYRGGTRDFKVVPARRFSFDSPQEKDCANVPRSTTCVSLTAASESKEFPQNDSTRPKAWIIRSAVKNARGQRKICQLRLTQEALPLKGAIDRMERQAHESQSQSLSKIQSDVMQRCDKHSDLRDRINDRITRVNQELPQLIRELKVIQARQNYQRAARQALIRERAVLAGQIRQLDKDIKEAIPNTSQLESEIRQLDQAIAALEAQRSNSESEYNSFFNPARTAYLVSANRKNGEGLIREEQEVWDRQNAFLSQQDTLRGQIAEQEGEKTGKQSSLNEIIETGTLNKANLQREKAEKEELHRTKSTELQNSARQLDKIGRDLKAKNDAIKRLTSVGNELVEIHPFCSLLNPPAASEE